MILIFGFIVDEDLYGSPLYHRQIASYQQALLLGDLELMFQPGVDTLWPQAFFAISSTTPRTRSSRRP
jgi:hypothetical protein